MTVHETKARLEEARGELEHLMSMSVDRLVGAGAMVAAAEKKIDYWQQRLREASPAPAKVRRIR